MDYLHSLGGRLFKLVFGAYLVLAILVTIVQLVIEYSNIQSLISSDLISLGKSFSGGVTEAMWELDRPLLNTMSQGISQSSNVTGVRISSADGVTFAVAGTVPDMTSSESNAFFAPFLFNSTPLTKYSSTGKREIGQLTIFSDRSVALKRIMHSFTVILINSIVKTLGLWIIFYLVVNRDLSHHLSKLTEMVSRIKFASESNESISLEYPYQDELGELAESMVSMQERLVEARKELEGVNSSLENTVAERTQSLLEALNFSETILLSSPLPMAVYKSNGECALTNNAYATLFDISKSALLEKNFNSSEMPGFRDHCMAALAHHKAQKIEMNFVTSRGRSLCLECRILPTHTNGEDHLLVQLIDLTERKRIEEDLRHHAFHDPLTQLPNRRLLLDRLNQAIHSSKRQRSHLAVLFLDLNKFKWLNDTYGHDVGDQMLIEVARRLTQSIRTTDTVSRLGGDEFVVLLEGLGPDMEQAKKFTVSVSDKIRMSLSADFILGSIHHQSSVSIGMKIFLDDGGDPDQILKEADEAMYDAKKAETR